MKKLIFSVLFFAGCALTQISAQTCQANPICDKSKACKPQSSKAEGTASVSVNAQEVAAKSKACVPTCDKNKACKLQGSKTESTTSVQTGKASEPAKLR